MNDQKKIELVKKFYKEVYGSELPQYFADLILAVWEKRRNINKL